MRVLSLSMRMRRQICGLVPLRTTRSWQISERFAAWLIAGHTYQLWTRMHAWASQPLSSPLSTRSGGRNNCTKLDYNLDEGKATSCGARQETDLAKHPFTLVAEVGFP